MTGSITFFFFFFVAAMTVESTDSSRTDADIAKMYVLGCDVTG